MDISMDISMDIHIYGKPAYSGKCTPQADEEVEIFKGNIIFDGRGRVGGWELII